MATDLKKRGRPGVFFPITQPNSVVICIEYNILYTDEYYITINRILQICAIKIKIIYRWLLL